MGTGGRCRGRVEVVVAHHGDIGESGLPVVVVATAVVVATRLVFSAVRRR